jgi:succinate dehydrogenase / fumarate reductase cytochrome b subunit
MWRIYTIHNVMFILLRLTGLALLVYLVLHIATVSTALLAGGAAFDRTMAMLARPGFMALDIALLGCVLFHALNGLRIIMNERGWLPQHRDGFASLTVTATLGLWVAASAVAIFG